MDLMVKLPTARATVSRRSFSEGGCTLPRLKFFRQKKRTMDAGHKYFLAVARKFRYPGSPIFSTEKIWLRPSATQRKQNHLLASPAQQKTAQKRFLLRGRWVLTPRPLPCTNSLFS
jgi:hypothetical protein